MIELGIEHLLDSEMLSFDEDEFGPTVYSFPAPLKHMELSDIDNSIGKYATFGSEWIEEAIDNINANGKKVNLPTSGNAGENTIADLWAPLPIDRDDHGFQAELEEVEAQLDIIEGDNGYAASNPEERNGILISARATIRTLKEYVVSIDTLQATIIKPMKYLSKKFVDSAIGIAAKRALEVVLSWILS